VAKSALAKSDETMFQIEEAVSLGENSWTNADVVAFVKYRRALRNIVEGGEGPLPKQPASPAGTSQLPVAVPTSASPTQEQEHSSWW
jgi:hypothetical protein